MEAASDRVERELTAAFNAVNLPTLARMPVKYQPSVVHDRSNNAVWIRIPKGSPVRHFLATLIVSFTLQAAVPLPRP